jgi:hypothetical protein
MRTTHRLLTHAFRTPAVTTRMVVRLWEISRPARDSELLTQEFVSAYTFAEP